MISKNDELIVTIDGYNSEGQGIARSDGFVIFVPFSISGEKLKVHIIKVTKNYAVGKIVNIIESSPERIDPSCPYFAKCGGCSLQHMNYAKTLEAKKNIVRNALVKIGGFKDIQSVDIVPSDKEYFYRNKAAFPLFIDDDGKLQVSMFKGLSHEPIFIDNCLITDNLINKVAKAFKEIVNKFYASTKKHFKYLVVRVVDGKVLVVVVSSVHIKNANVMLSELKNELKLGDDDIGIFECKKISDNNVILEGNVDWLCGIKCINCDILGVKVLLSAKSFFQVNVHIMQEIYKKAIQFAKNKVVVDAYSGAGLMSALLSQSAKHVYGLEIVKEATNDADAMAKENGIKNITNINCDVADKLPEVINAINEDCLLVLDPPRKGLDGKVVQSILQSSVKEIVYVSCNPATLARDLKLICAGGYKLKEVKAYDMFPQTQHVETLVKIERA